MGSLSPYFPNPTFVAIILYGRSPLIATVVLVSTNIPSLLEQILPNFTCYTAMVVAIRQQAAALRNLGQR